MVHVTGAQQIPSLDNAVVTSSHNEHMWPLRSGTHCLAWLAWVSLLTDKYKTPTLGPLRIGLL